MLTDERKESIVQEIEYLFSIISSRSHKRTRGCDDLGDGTLYTSDNDKSVS